MLLRRENKIAYNLVAIADLEYFNNYMHSIRLSRLRERATRLRRVSALAAVGEGQAALASPSS